MNTKPINSLFKSEADRNLWLRLNAEHQIESDKNSYAPNGMPYSNALHPRSMDKAIEIARNQLVYDEKQGKLRFTLKDYLLLDYNQLQAIRLKQHQEWCKKFDSLK